MDARDAAGSRFIPPFCPNPNCLHHCDLSRPWRWKRRGFFARLTAPFLVPRFTCLRCRRSFSSQTFSTTYWLKRADLPPQVFMKAVGGMANRQIARDLGVAPSTIDRVLGRMGRHCLLFQSHKTAGAKPRGPLVMDSFESFEYSQFFPMQHHLAIEAGTSFFWAFTDSPLRRKGRMTVAQKRRREELERQIGRPDPQAIEKDVRLLLESTLRGVPRITLRTDDHRAYPRAMAGLACEIRHQITSSKERRDAHNPLFEVNLADLLARHSQANHRRETIAWSKRRQRSAERLALFLAWRNYVKWRWEKRCRQTPAMLQGIATRRLTVQDLFKERLFRSRIALATRWAEYYDAVVETPALGKNRRHALRYAY